MPLSGFPYDAQLLAALASEPESIADVLATMRAIDDLTVEGDGLKWFNQLYFQVTQTVEARVSLGATEGGFSDPAFLASLDVQFARLYFNALANYLGDKTLPGCWEVLFSSRGVVTLARIQCALAGINAHINHDLPFAIVATCELAGTAPAHDTGHYSDYTVLNTALDSLIETAKHELNVRLLGDSLPAVTSLEDVIAAWSVSAAREAAWNNSEILWNLRGQPLLTNGLESSLDGLTTVVGKTLLVPIPV